MAGALRDDVADDPGRHEPEQDRHRREPHPSRRSRPFSRAGIPAFKSLGQTADVGTQALEVAEPTIALLGDFTDDAVSLSTQPREAAHEPARRERHQEPDGPHLQRRRSRPTGTTSSATTCARRCWRAATRWRRSSTRPAPRTSSRARAARARRSTRRSRAPRSRRSSPARTPRRCCAATSASSASRSATRPQPQPVADKPADQAAGQPGTSRTEPGKRRRTARPDRPRRGRARLPAGRREVTRRRGATAIASNPVLVGVATTLVIVVAVFLAYNANQGLPWVPSYRLTAEVPRASSLVKGNEVRIGGLRVGVVDKITPVQQDNGAVMAKLDLKLETRIKPLPVDSTIMIRPRSALGLKYVEVTKGDSAQGFAEGGTIPLEERDARAGRVRRVLQHVGRAHARRQPAEPARVRRRLRRPRRGPQPGAPGARAAGRRTRCRCSPTSRRPETNFRRFFASQAQAAIITEPVAVQLGELWSNLSLTLAAFADVARPVPAGHDHQGPERPGDVHRGGSRRCGRSSGRPASSSPSCSPARTRCVPRADELASGFERGVKGLAGLARPEPPPVDVPRRLRGLRAGPDRARSASRT